MAEESGKITKQKTNFTAIPNKVLTFPMISLKAKWLYAYICSKPDGWEFSAERMSKENNDGVDAILAGLKELIEAGFVERKKQKTGKTKYNVLARLAKKPMENGKEINELMGMFYEFNKGLNFTDKRQHEALQWLLTGGIDNAKETINYALSIQKEKYAPVITTPLELKTNIGKVKSFKLRN